MTTFALLHGGAHGGWCWDEVVPILHGLGYDTVAPDLPMDEPVSVRQWAQVVVDALGPDPGDVVGVAHSLGGLALPVLATMIPLRRMIFVAALVPMPGMGFFEYVATQDGMLVVDSQGPPVTDDQGRSLISWETAREAFYNDCSPEVARAAFDRLRPVAPTAFLEPCPIDVWPQVPSAYLLGQDDHAVGADWARRVAKERLDTVAVELPGGHSPFLTRPAELVDAILSTL